MLNDDSPTRTDTSNGNVSYIDISFCHPNLSNKITWGVIDDNMGSDHFPILITVGKCFNSGTVHSGDMFNFEKADWKTLHKLGQHLKEEDIYDKDINNHTNKLTEAILRMARECVPAKKTAKKRSLVPSWDEGCQKALDARKKALRNFKRNPILNNLNLLKQAENNSKQVT